MSNILSYQQFVTQSAKLKVETAYLILGEDAYLTDKTCQMLKNIVKKHFDAFETVILYGDELSVSDISEYLDSYSIFAQNRLLLVRNASRLGEADINRMQPEKQKRMLEIIADYLKDPEATQIVILMADKVDARQSGWKSIKDSCQVIVCEPIRHAGHMKAWLEEVLRQHRKSMEDKAKTLFLEKVELDFYTAENEIEKLFIYVGERSQITVDDVHVTLPTSRTGTMADFYRALGTRNAGQVISKVNQMLDNEWVDLQILAIVFRFFMILWKIQVLRAKHITPAEIRNKHLSDIFESQRDDYISYASKFTDKELSHIFAILMDTDSQIKLSMAESKVLMTLCMTKICNGSR
jgi:DNA polymerase-3 subunit delta